MPTTYVIVQIREKNREIEKIKISLEECNVLDRHIKVENEQLKVTNRKYVEAIDELRACGLQLVQKYEKLTAKHQKTIDANKLLAKIGRTWKIEALKHLSHINMLNKNLKARRDQASEKLNTSIKTS